MPRKPKSTAGERTPIAGDCVERLVEAVQTLTEEVRVLREAIDELREEYGWAARNAVGDEFHRPVMHISSLPKNPCATDFGERINRIMPEDISTDSNLSERPETPGQQGELW